MSQLTRRGFTGTLLVASFLPALALANEGIIIRFRVEEKTLLPTGESRKRTYENAILMKFEEMFATDLDGEFRVSLLPHRAGDAARVDVVVHDISRNGAFAGNGVAEVQFVGETTLDLLTEGGRSYSIILRAQKHELPSRAA